MKLTKLGMIALALMGSAFAYAEHTAPVYDVDSMSTDNQVATTVPQQDNDSKPIVNLGGGAPSTEAPASLDQRIARLEQQLENGKQSSEANNRINSMQGEIQALRGQVEELTHQLQELRNQQKNMRTEVDKPVSKDLAEQTMSPVPRESDEDSTNSTNPQKPLHTKAAVKTKPVVAEVAAKKVVEKTSPVPPQPNIAEEQAAYQTAYNLIKMKKYSEAIGSLQKMLAKYPNGQFAANAHYWLGDLYSLTGENEHAATEFSSVIEYYPNNPRVADAELKLGLINATLLKWPAAKASFKKVVSKYPGTTSARLAMEQLKLLKQAGH